MADKRSFEEQVRDELAGFSIEPEAQVWDDLHKTLDKDRKRRGIAWFFLFAVVAGVAGYLGYTAWLPGGNMTAISTVNNNTEQPGYKPGIKNTGAVNGIDRPLLNATGKNDTHIPAIAAEKRARISIKLFPNPGNKNELPKPAMEADLVISDRRQEKEPAKYGVQGSRATDKFAILQGADQPVKAAAPPDVDAPATKEGKAGTIPVITAVQDSLQPAPGTTLPSESKKKNNNWKFGLAADIGKSNLISNLISFNVFSSSLPAFSYSNAAAGGNYYTPGTRQGYSFGIGGEATKELNKRWSFTGSLGYQLYTTKVNVGEKVDSLQNGRSYYEVGYDKLHTNLHHFLQAEAMFNRRFSLASRFTMRWNIGMGVNWLFANNALHFNPVSRTLYVDNSNLARVQTNISTGLDFGFGKKPAFFIGPNLDLFLSKYEASLSNGSEASRFIRLGIKTHIQFGRR